MEYNREVMIILFDYLTLSSMIIFIHLFKLSSMISSKNHCHLNISFSSLIKKVENLKSVDIRCTEGRNVIVPIRCCANCICIFICVFLYFVFLVPSGIFHLSLNNQGFSGICYLRTQ